MTSARHFTWHPGKRQQLLPLSRVDSGVHLAPVSHARCPTPEDKSSCSDGQTDPFHLLGRCPPKKGGGRQDVALSPGEHPRPRLPVRGGGLVPWTTCHIRWGPIRNLAAQSRGSPSCTGLAFDSDTMWWQGATAGRHWPEGAGCFQDRPWPGWAAFLRDARAPARDGKNNRHAINHPALTHTFLFLFCSVFKSTGN